MEANNVRDFTIEAVPSDGLQGAWVGVAEEVSARYPGYEFDGATVCEFGFAEEVIALLYFRKEKEYLFHVGIGEALRPYDKKYEGSDLGLASRTWLLEVKWRMEGV